MVAFINRHRERYGVEPICAMLPIALSTCYEHKAREADPERMPPRAKRDEQLRPEFRREWEENFRVYGAKKIWRQLNPEAIYVARFAVERLMGEMGLCGVVRGKRVKTTSGRVGDSYDNALTRRSLDCTRPKSSVSVALGETSKTSSLPNWSVTPHRERFP